MKRVAFCLPSVRSLLVAVVILGSAAPARAQSSGELPPFDKVSEGFKQVPVTGEGDRGLFNIWVREKDDRMLAELPRNFASKRFFIALTVSSGDRYAGLQAGDWVVQWRRYNNRMALISPNLDVRASGEDEAKASVKRLFTDEVLLDVPIVAMGPGPNAGPVIDIGAMLVDRENVNKFFGSSVRITNPRLVKIERSKVFNENVELAFEIVGSGGRLQSLHFSFSEVPAPSAGFKPRKADQRVGYFTTSYSDLSRYEDDDTRVRYINRWHLEKRDPKLRLSPPKEPIRFYVEHTTPVRYRRWVKEGAEYWNKAFEKVGILDAIVVEYQDAQSGAHMEKDPEDVRYNFIRWLNNDVGTAIGPSRVHPETGQILDADIILTDGWIRHFNFNYNDLMPELAMEGMGPDTLAWLAKRPHWDPRMRLAPLSHQVGLQRDVAAQSQRPMAGHRLAGGDSTMLGTHEYDGLYNRTSQVNGMCHAAFGRQMDLALARMNWALALMADEEAAADKKKKEEEEKEKAKKDKAEKEGEGDESEASSEAKEEGEKEGEQEKDEESSESSDAKEDEKEGDASRSRDADLLDGIPDWFVGPLLADLVAHEVGHTLGLRHNFKASAVHTLEEINSGELKGKKTIAGSVMDYNPINYRYEAGELQGDYAMTGIGPYDYWAIEYGYTFDEKKLPEILKRCSEPELQYATDEDTIGSDPLAQRYDFSSNPLDYAQEQMKLVELYRSRILEKFVRDGDSWARARRGFELTLGLQVRAVNMMSRWVGGAFVHRDKKGDPGNRPPLEVVPAERQREALQFVIDTTFRDEAYGLSPELLERMGVDRWLDRGARTTLSSDSAWPIHDRVLGIQASALTMLMNPTTLQRVYDNELRLSPETDALTLPELLETISKATWTELGAEPAEEVSARRPMISSLRRNLQREHLNRLIDLVLDSDGGSAAHRPIVNLAAMGLRDLKTEIAAAEERLGDKMDAYTRSHLAESRQRIERALDAGYTIGGNQQQPMILLFGSAGSDVPPEGVRVPR